MKPPIADPFPPLPSNDEPWRVFRLRFWHFLMVILALSFVCSAPLIWFRLGNKSAGVQRDALTAGLAPAIATAVVLSLGIVYFLPTSVNRYKLKSTDMYGLHREIDWSQVQKVRFLWIFFPFAIISTPTKRNFIWLPLFLNDMKGFARAVEEWAPDDNPLRLFLQKREF